MSGCSKYELCHKLRQFYLDDDDLKNVTTDIERGDGEGVCFILDGLDEYQPQNEHTHQ